ncbi:uncharacterized protein LOC130807744 [Amaranthus tricolor]|uniref:uncharacterized protein LOC130807744 n=1 Tax=Amaranthus tricolor TaxID=29722 RepID=UPI00258C60C5|nr:uncharacterized protein LOC130807744 [Amaranthus tricolor]
MVVTRNSAQVEEPIIADPQEFKREGQLHMLSSPSQMVSLCDKLNDNPRTAVKEIGFEGLLLLRIKMSYHGMAKYFINQYDVSTSVFIVNQNCKYTITEYDVCDIFGLPLTVNDVIKQTNSNEDISEYDLFEEWQQKLDCVGTKDISAEQLLSKMLLDLTDGGDDFKRFFVMYAFITFLAPNSHRTVDHSLLKPLVDVKEIKNLNWCGLVFDRFRNGLERCQTKNLKNIPSCLAILEICFYHRVSSLGIFPSSRLPLIQHWTYETLKKRAQLELKARSFGLGDFDGDTYPVSKKLRKKSHDDEVELEENGMYLKIPIPDGLLASSDQKIHDTAGDELMEEVSKMKRNMEIVTQHHLSRLLKLKAKGNQAQDVGQSSNSPTLSQWYSDPKVMEEIDEIMNRIRVVKRRTADIDLPSFDLGISNLEKTPSPAPKLIAKKRGKKKI